MQGFRRQKKLSTWRTLALHAWGPPTNPSIFANLEIDATEASAWLARLRREGGPRITITHLVGHALALAIRERPEVNSIIRLGSLYRRESIDIYFQVAFEGGEDLNGHKVVAADRKDVVTIARELEEGARAVRERRSEAVANARSFKKFPAALTGVAMKLGTFAHYDLGLDMRKLGVPWDGFGSAMVSNIGSFGLETALAPTPPFTRCGMLLIVGSIHDKAVVRDGQVVARPILPIGVTLDHRIVDGYQASKLAARFVHIMEHPQQALGDPMTRA